MGYSWEQPQEFREITPDSKVHGANMGPIWCWQDPGEPHVGPMNFAIWVHYMTQQATIDINWVNTGPGSGMLSYSQKPRPDPILTKHQLN